jgi:rare lipoprotein A
VIAVGKASWYGAFHHGRRTASGERFDMNALTAAHRTLPLGTRLRVTNLSNGRSVDVRVNDRGPAIQSRIIDVSRGVAVALDAVAAGVFPVELALVD